MIYSIIKDVMIDRDCTRKEAKNHIIALVSFYRFLPSLYESAYYLYKNGIITEGLPEECSDPDILHDYAKDYAVEEAENWAFFAGMQHERPISENNCRDVLYGKAIDNLLEGDHDTWMRAAQAQR